VPWERGANSSRDRSLQTIGARVQGAIAQLTAITQIDVSRTPLGRVSICPISSRELGFLLAGVLGVEVFLFTAMRSGKGLIRRPGLRLIRPAAAGDREANLRPEGLTGAREVGGAIRRPMISQMGRVWLGNHS